MIALQIRSASICRSTAAFEAVPPGRRADPRLTLDVTAHVSARSNRLVSDQRSR